TAIVEALMGSLLRSGAADSAGRRAARTPHPLEFYVTPVRGQVRLSGPAGTGPVLLMPPAVVEFGWRRMVPRGDARRRRMSDQPLPLKAIHHVELLVGNARQAAYYYRHAFGFSQLAYAGPETGVKEQASYVLYQGSIRLVVSTPLSPDDPMADHLRRHGDGVLDIAFLVDAVAACFAQAVERAAHVALPPYDRADQFGKIRRAKIRAYGDTLHSLISTADYNGPFLPGYQVRRRPAPGAGLERIDHIVGNVENGRMNDWGTYYNKVLGFHQFMSFDDKDISTEFS